MRGSARGVKKTLGRLAPRTTVSVSAQLIRELASEAGFDLVRFGPADPGPHADHFARWLDAGRAGEMEYLHRNRQRITQPESWVPQARSAITLGYDYGGPPAGMEGGARIARYARGRDYHRFLGKATRRLREQLEREGVARGSMAAGTDAIPILERGLAAQAGIGFLAKSSGIISPQLGPYLLLAELLTPLDLPNDGPSPGSCGTCTRCLDACPTGAIVAPFELDARRCLSYTTIELRGPIPEPMRAAQGSWLFGCDICLEVCPFTSKGRVATPSDSTPAPLRPHAVVEDYSLVGVLELSEEDYQRDWVGTAMRRATRSGLRRNAAVVLGNLGNTNAVPALTTALNDGDAIVRGHAAWALGRLEPRSRALRSALEHETDPAVRGEIRQALDGSSTPRSSPESGRLRKTRRSPALLPSSDDIRALRRMDAPHHALPTRVPPQRCRAAAPEPRSTVARLRRSADAPRGHPGRPSHTNPSMAWARPSDRHISRRGLARRVLLGPQNPPETPWTTKTITTRRSGAATAEPTCAT